MDFDLSDLSASECENDRNAHSMETNLLKNKHYGSWVVLILIVHPKVILNNILYEYNNPSPHLFFMDGCAFGGFKNRTLSNAI